MTELEKLKIDIERRLLSMHNEFARLINGQQKQIEALKTDVFKLKSQGDAA